MFSEIISLTFWMFTIVQPTQLFFLTSKLYAKELES